MFTLIHQLLNTLIFLFLFVLILLFLFKMDKNATHTTQTNQTSAVNESYLWKLPSARYRLEDIKHVQNHKKFESPTFKINSFDCYLELYPNGCHQGNVRKTILIICIKSMPESISSLTSILKLSLKETNTVVVRRYTFRQNHPYYNWPTNAVELNQIQHLNELTFEVTMDIEKITDISGNIIERNPIDFQKKRLIRRMVLTEQCLEQASEYLLSQCTVKHHICFDPEAWLYDVGVIHYIHGNYKKAIETCLKIKSDGDELLVIGRAYQHMNDHENAIQYYEKYMSQVPQHKTKIMNVPCRLGECYNALGNVDKAKEWFSKGEKIRGQSNGIMLKRAFAYFDERKPNHYSDIGYEYRKLGDKVKSKEFWIKGVIRHPNDITLNIGYANHFINSNPRRSLFYNWKIIKKYGQRIDVLIKIIKALKILNKVDECIHIINNVMNLIKKVYEMKLNKEAIVDSDSYTYALNKSKKDKTKLLIMYQFQILDYLQSITPGDKYMHLFREILDFIITINQEFSTEENMLCIIKWLLYVKDIKQLQVIYDEWKDWTVKAIKTFAFVYYQLKEYAKSIEILLRVLDMKEIAKDEHDELTSCYYGLCLNYLELNNNDMYNKYQALALEKESKCIKLESWNKYFHFDENNGKYLVTDPNTDITFDFDADNINEFEKPQQSLIEYYKHLDIQTNCNQDENEDIFEEIEEKDVDTDPVVINYCHYIEWQLINEWYEKAISTSVHSIKWNELYLECLLNLKRYADVFEYIEMFNLRNKLCDALLLEIGNYCYFKREKLKTALKYYDLIQDADSEKVMLGKARCHRRLNHTVKAIEYYQKVLTCNAFGYFYVGWLSYFSNFLLDKVGDFENAQRFMFRGLWLDCSNDDILETFASWLSHPAVAKFDDALIIHTKIFNSSKTPPAQASRTFQKLKQNKKAIDLIIYSISTGKDTIFTNAFNNLGYCYYELYKQSKMLIPTVSKEILTFYLNESRKYLKYSLTIDDAKKSPYSHCNYANLLFFGFRKFRFAEIYYEHGIRIIENCKPEERLYFDTECTQQCLLNYGKLLRCLKKYEKSNEHLNKAIDFKLNCKSKMKDLFEGYDECQQLISLNIMDLDRINAIEPSSNIAMCDI
eukprot:289825_1